MKAPNPYAFPLKPSNYAPAPLPSLEEWNQLRNAWDLVTTRMIPAGALMEKPIPLRNPLLFYLGHIPTFEDIHLTRATGQTPTEPAYYHVYFERGIDPDVDDPTKCHDHSQLPDVFPSLGEILGYREKVKARITELYTTGRAHSDRHIQRAIWIGFEHEALHTETFLFMTIQSPNILPPPDILRPDFRSMANIAISQRIENQWHRVPTQDLTIGYEDPERDDGPDRFFAWDNEREPYDVTVPSFEAQARPISNGEYAIYLADKGLLAAAPVTWDRKCDSPEYQHGHEHVLERFISMYTVKTVWGPVPLNEALEWPVMASFDDVQGYTKWAGARLPTLHEIRSFHEHVEQQRGAPPSRINKKTHTDPHAIFADLTGTNSGFRNFHPTPVTQKGDRLCGLGDTGGAAEWTSDLFGPQPGFKPMGIYPGYSADFMDGKHIAVVGGSWALHPRVAGRKSLYVFVAA